jgi:hypothetical protein
MGLGSTHRQIFQSETEILLFIAQWLVLRDVASSNFAFCPHSFYAFRMIFPANSDYFPEEFTG